MLCIVFSVCIANCVEDGGTGAVCASVPGSRAEKAADYGSSLHDAAAALLRARLSLARFGVAAVDLAHEVVENLVDVDLRLGRRLEEGARECASE